VSSTGIVSADQRAIGCAPQPDRTVVFPAELDRRQIGLALQQRDEQRLGLVAVGDVGRAAFDVLADGVARGYRLVQQLVDLGADGLHHQRIDPPVQLGDIPARFDLPGHVDQRRGQRDQRQDADAQSGPNRNLQIRPPTQRGF